MGVPNRACRFLRGKRILDTRKGWKMEAASIEDRLRNMIVQRLFLEVSPEDLDEEANLQETYDVDSVGLFELVIGLEEVFGISLEEEEFEVERFATVRAIAELVREKLAEDR